MPTPPTTLRLGVSHCLLGASVRYDGGHQHDHFVAERLAPMVEWVPVCPEFDSGMGAPRPAIELRGDPQRPQIREVVSGRDLTESFGTWCAERATELSVEGLDGFVLKSASPSCGLREVPVYSNASTATQSDGLFARALLAADPTLPLCREDDLGDENRRRAFFLQSVSRSRRRNLPTRSSDRPDRPAALVFLQQHRLALLARGVGWESAQHVWGGHADFASASRWLASELTAAETHEGNLAALTLAISWLDELDQHHWFAFAPMLEEIRRVSMLPQVLRVTLHLVAQCHGVQPLLAQLYLHPWLCGRSVELEHQGPASAVT